MAEKWLGPAEDEGADGGIAGENFPVYLASNPQSSEWVLLIANQTNAQTDICLAGDNWQCATKPASLKLEGPKQNNYYVVATALVPADSIKLLIKDSSKERRLVISGRKVN